MNTEVDLSIALLHRVARQLDQAPDVDAVIGPVLSSIVESSRAARAILTTVNRQDRRIQIVEADGLSDQQVERGQYAFGEGVIGEVVESGRPVLVPRVSSDKRFLNRTGALNETLGETAFICVPISLEATVLGALAVHLPCNDGEDTDSLESMQRLLEVLATMLALAVRLRQQGAESAEDGDGSPTEAHFRPASLIGSSKPLNNVFDLVGPVVSSSTTVLVLGESGTGKELLARAIHEASPRSDGPFIAVNCGALPESLIESELFGHERGAFSGAVNQRKGRFELAHGGTIFLDEVGELTPQSQVKLLRVLQERVFERVGGTESVEVDVRVVAATSRNLEEMVHAAEFRKDLYYRLAVFPAHMPPLRDRGNDVVLLADHFIAKYNKRHLKQVRRIATSAIDMMLSYHWPGNVRELENCIERAVLLSTDDVIHGHNLPPSLQTAEFSGTEFEGSLVERVEALERELVLDALKSTRGNMAKAARKLGITERMMGLRVGKYEINPRRFKGEG